MMQAGIELSMPDHATHETVADPAEQACNPTKIG